MNRHSRNGFRKAPDPQFRIQTGIYDKLGRPLLEGDLVYLINKQDTLWQVVKCGTAMHPQAPPGAMDLVFQAHFQTVVPGGNQLGDVLLALPYEPPVKVDDAPPETDGPKLVLP